MLKFEYPGLPTYLVIQWEFSTNGIVELVISPSDLPVKVGEMGIGEWEDLDRVLGTVVEGAQLRSALRLAVAGHMSEHTFPRRRACETVLTLKSTEETGVVLVHIEEIYPPFLKLDARVSANDILDRLFGEE